MTAMMTAIVAEADMMTVIAVMTAIVAVNALGIETIAEMIVIAKTVTVPGLVAAIRIGYCDWFTDHHAIMGMYGVCKVPVIM